MFAKLIALNLKLNIIQTPMQAIHCRAWIVLIAILNWFCTVKSLSENIGFKGFLVQTTNARADCARTMERVIVSHRNGGGDDYHLA